MSEQKDNKITEGMTEYLQLIQEPIGRMSTISGIFKGFTATIVAGISSLTYSTTSIWVLILSFLPVLVFAGLDIYYLRMERRFRWLYNQVRLGQHQIDFSLGFVDESEEDQKEAKTRICDVAKSTSIWPFYLAMIIILVAVFVLKCTGSI